MFLEEIKKLDFKGLLAPLQGIELFVSEVNLYTNTNEEEKLPITYFLSSDCNFTSL